MKRIFIGSSSEAKAEVERVAKFLQSVSEVKIDPWFEVFQPGDWTFKKIEHEAREVSGAIFLATPDDRASQKNKLVNLPRTNVMLEFGYFAAIMEHNRIALCKYDGAELPSDLDGFNFIEMGELGSEKIDKSTIDNAHRSLSQWVNNLPDVSEGISLVQPLHVYSGKYRLKSVFKKWRDISLGKNDCVHIDGHLCLILSKDGMSGGGWVYGELSVDVKGCVTRFRLADEITDAFFNAQGKLTIESLMHYRQRVEPIKGEKPQEDGFEPNLSGPRKFKWSLTPTFAERLILKGEYKNTSGEKVISQAKVTLSRL